MDPITRQRFNQILDAITGANHSIHYQRESEDKTPTRQLDFEERMFAHFVIIYDLLRAWGFR